MAAKKTSFPQFLQDIKKAAPAAPAGGGAPFSGRQAPPFGGPAPAGPVRPPVKPAPKKPAPKKPAKKR
jgi:hypothetical protein